MGLLFIITFVFGIAFTQLAGTDPVLAEFFQTVPLSIYSLFIYGTFLDDLAYFCDTIMEHKPTLFAILVPFIGIACLTDAYRDDVPIWQLVGLLLVRSFGGLLHLRVEVQGDVGQLFLDVAHDFPLCGCGETISAFRQ